MRYFLLCPCGINMSVTVRHLVVSHCAFSSVENQKELVQKGTQVRIIINKYCTYLRNQECLALKIYSK